MRETINSGACTPSQNDYAWMVDGAVQADLFGALNFCSGVSQTNGERVVLDPSSGESAKAEFTGLQIFGASQNWTDWTDSAVCEDIDPLFDNILLSAGHVQVQIDPPNLMDSTPCY
ncbi:MAG TPA: hypothetical protein VK646_01870 [Actinomycetota bacterium]|nr:hypothetical protein [Actinomycetota bacterium]